MYIFFNVVSACYCISWKLSLLPSINTKWSILEKKFNSFLYSTFGYATFSEPYIQLEKDKNHLTFCEDGISEVYATRMIGSSIRNFYLDAFYEASDKIKILCRNKSFMKEDCSIKQFLFWKSYKIRRRNLTWRK